MMKYFHDCSHCGHLFSLDKLVPQMLFNFTLCHLGFICRTAGALGVARNHGAQRSSLSYPLPCRDLQQYAPYEGEAFVLSHKEKLHKPQGCLFIFLFQLSAWAHRT